LNIDENALPSEIAFSWLLILRWGATCSQILLILAVNLCFDIDIPLLIASLIIAFQAGSNLFFTALWKRRVELPEWLFALTMFLDMLLLTALLFYTGGAMNPFTFLYLIHIVLGAVLLQPRWAWSLTIFTVSCYGCFFLPTDRLFAGTFLAAAAQIHDAHNLTSCHNYLDLHLQGMWVAFSVTAVFIVFCVGWIQKALRIHQQTLVSLREEKDRSEKLASLANLAAGAAHEFSTPLSTIAVASTEMLRVMRSKGGDQELIADAELIRDQIEGCKEILYQMTADAGEHLGEAVEEFLMSSLILDVVSSCSELYPNEIILESKVMDARVRMPPLMLRRAVRGLLKNAADASSPDSPIRLRLRKDTQYLTIEVEDTGTGMDEQTAARALDPFFTTKEQGKGLGLGLYLTRTLAEKFGGGVAIRSTPGKGTVVSLSLALEDVHFSG